MVAGRDVFTGGPGARSGDLIATEAVEFQARLLAAVGQAVIATDITGLILYWNAAASDTYGWTAEEVMGKQISTLLWPVGGREIIVDEIAQGLRDGDPWTGELWSQTKSGVPIPVLLTDTGVYDDDGVRVGTIGVSSDISERLRGEAATALLVQRIELDHRRLAAAQASAKLGSFEVDLDTCVVTRSDELCRILGVEPGVVSDIDFRHVHPDDRERVRRVVGQVVAGHDEGDSTYRIVRPDGEERWVLSQATVIRAPGSNVVAGTMLDITDRHRVEMALVYRATHDSVTNLPNRGSLHESLQSAMSRLAPNQFVVLAVIDIDEFKRVNDGVGHSRGDRALAAIAERLRSGLRPTDIVARVGGDEFVAVRIEARTLQDAHQLGQDVMQLLGTPFALDDGDLSLGFSVGVTLSTSTDSPESLLRDADDAMYQAKRDGKNQVQVFDEHARARAHRRQSLAEALPNALQSCELHLEYQPILELATAEIAGFESLLRWDHPTLGSISPAEFIPIAETSGLILAIGAWVLDHSLEQLAAWRADPRLPPDMWMAINVSAQQLAQSHLVDNLLTAIDRAGVPAGSVHLEITESVLMDRVDHALGTIVELQAAGVNVSIDDFGTGYSSLSYLSRLPVDIVKIDRSFVTGLGAGPGHDTSIVRAMIALADALNLDVVAEGVELQTHLDALIELGCGYGQGFLWSSAMRAADAVDWMLDRASTAHAHGSGAHEFAGNDSPTDIGAAIVEIAQLSGRRRRGAQDMTNMLRFESLEIGLSARRAWLAGRDVELATKEFELLAFMAQHAGKIFSRNDLLREVWHSSPDWQNPTTVTEHIHRLRCRIELDPSRPRLIHTARGLGYCFGPPHSATVAG